MAEQGRTFEAEVRQVKATRMTPDPKREELYSQPLNPPKRAPQRTFSRETVVRLIDWLKQE